MGLYFGTDGLRGIVNEDLTYETAFKCGNALSFLKKNPKVVIGRDTRVSGEYLTLAVALGACAGGAKVIDTGIMPTAGVAYLTRLYKADYGVVISASHNPKEYNGIKIFDQNGYKLGDKQEERVERCFIHSKINEFPDIGGYEFYKNAAKDYEKFLISNAFASLKDMRIVLDGANGAASRIAPQVFRALGASVVATNCFADGMRINEKCGATYIAALKGRMKRYCADVGFAFDGDSDRLIAVDSDGNVVDGDAIIYVLAKYLKEKGKLNKNTAVGTSHTNMAYEKALKAEGIDFIRTDIGDKYVLQKLAEDGLSLGGEQSGHIILKDIHSTGDGILTAVVIASVLSEKSASLSELACVKPYPQINVNVIISDKHRVINSEAVSEKVAEIKSALGGEGRVMVRASGTEPKIRIMVEGENEEICQKYAEELKAVVIAAEK